MLLTEAPLGRARGSQPGAQAGRRPGWARNGDRFKIAARTCANGRGSRAALFGVEFAPNCTLIGTLWEKPGENRQKRGGKWRQMALFRGSKAPFRRARSRLRWIASRQSARPYVCGVRLPRAATGPTNRRWSAIFHRLGHEPTCVRPSRFHDCADFVARWEGRAARASSERKVRRRDLDICVSEPGGRQLRFVPDGQPTRSW